MPQSSCPVQYNETPHPQEVLHDLNTDIQHDLPVPNLQLPHLAQTTASGTQQTGNSVETGAWVFSGRLPRLDLRVLSSRPDPGRQDKQGGPLREASVLFVLSELGILYMPGGEDGDTGQYPVDQVSKGVDPRGRVAAAHDRRGPEGQNARFQQHVPATAAASSATLTAEATSSRESVEKEAIVSSGLSHRLIFYLNSVELQLAHPEGTSMAQSMQSHSAHDNFLRIEGLRGSLQLRCPLEAPTIARHNSREHLSNPPVGGEQQQRTRRNASSEESCRNAAGTAVVVISRVEARANLRSQQVHKIQHFSQPAFCRPPYLLRIATYLLRIAKHRCDPQSITSM
jgi:hypothetical protein